MQKNDALMLNGFQSGLIPKENMKINEHLLKISAAYIYLDQPLELGSEVDIVVRGSVVKLEDKDNQDGTCDRVYTVRGEIALLNNGIIDEERAHD